MGYVLRKSYGSWSAGTKVDVLEPAYKDQDIELVTVRTRSPQADGRNAIFDVPVELLEKRRDHYIDR